MKVDPNVKGFFLASRIPNLVIIAVTITSAVYMLKRHGFEVDFDWTYLLLAASTMMIAAGGYIINDYFDHKIDMVNRPERVVVGRILTRRKALVAHLLLSNLAIIIGFIASLKIGLLHIFSVTLLFFYSNHLRRFFIGKIAIAILACLCVLSVGIAYEITSIRLMAFSAFGAAIIWIRELIKELESMPGEQLFGVESVPTVWGISGTKMMISLIGACAIGVLIYFIIEIESQLFTYYYLGMAFPVTWVAFYLYRADKQEEFTWIRRMTNFLILAGLVSMWIV